MSDWAPQLSWRLQRKCLCEWSAAPQFKMAFAQEAFVTRNVCPRKSVSQECQMRVFDNNVKKSVAQECRVRASYKSAKKRSQVRVSCKSVKSESVLRQVSSKGVLQEGQVGVFCQNVNKTYQVKKMSRRQRLKARPL